MESRPLESTIADAELAALSATASAAIRWGRRTFGPRICILSSMQETTLIDLAMRVDRSIPVVFLDTGYHFDETLETVSAVEQRYDITVEVVSPANPVRSNVSAGQCCDGKVEQLNAALQNRDAWITGIRRQQTTNRETASIIALGDPRRRTKSEEANRSHAQRVKISPLAQWDQADVDSYRVANQLIRNPLLDRGYTSIGCRTCTTQTGGADDVRAGRWADSDRTECGLHL